MKQPRSSFQPGHFTQLVTHLHEFEPSRREEIAELYGAPASEATELAEYWLRHPDRVVEVVRQELNSSVEWRIVEEAVMEHDLGVMLDWAPARGRHQVARLGLLEPKLDHTGHYQAVMPGALAAIFADRVRGQRGSLPVLLGRKSDDEVRRLARQWELDDEGSKIEVILRICDHFGREEMIDELLEQLPNPNWIGDALMILELGGICHWQAIYGYDLDDNLGRSDDKVVPLMRDHERRQQQRIAERLMELGVVFRFNEEHREEGPLVAVPEALWPGLWQLGRRWLMDWNREAMQWLRERTTNRRQAPEGPGLQKVMKWWLCESRADRLSWSRSGDTTELSMRTLERLAAVYDGPVEYDWNDVWHLGRRLQILDEHADGAIGAGREAETLVEGSGDEFVGEVLLEWCLGYSGERADEKLTRAIGLDESWRSRATALMRREGEPVPLWMGHSGVESHSTGGGWLRHTGTGHDDMVLFESGLAVTFVMMAKILWLDLLSLLASNRRYPVDGLIGLMQNVAGLAMFGQLRLVLEEQPAPVYLPFQRASLLMDDRQAVPVGEWVDDIIDGLLIPLGVAERMEGQEDVIALNTERLRVEDPPGWPSGQRKKLVSEIFEENIDFELSDGNGSVLREVATGPETSESVVSIEEPLARLLELAADHEIRSFDGEFLEFGEE